MENLTQIWSNLINSQAPSWVLFENGTCVFLARGTASPAEAAKKLLQQTNSAEADSLWEHQLGYIVIASNLSIGTLVELHDLDPLATGRLRRQMDVQSPKVIHVEFRADLSDGQPSIDFTRQSGLKATPKYQPEGVLRAINLILEQAAQEGTQQIVFLPESPKGSVVFHQHDSQRTVMTPPVELFANMTDCLRQLAGITRGQQQGRVNFTRRNRETVPFALSIQNTNQGDVCTLRLA